MLKLAVFDLDGTLVNTIADLAYSCNCALEKFGHPTHSVESYKYFVGNGVYKLVERAAPEDCRDKGHLMEIKKEFDRVYNENYLRQSKPYDGIKEQLKRFNENGIKVAVLSNKPNVFTQKMVTTLFGDIEFACVFGQRENVPVKPDPCAVLQIMEQCGADKNETCYIGDSNVDILTAINSGAAPIGVSWGFRGRDELADAGAKFIVDNPNELYDCCTAAVK